MRTIFLSYLAVFSLFILSLSSCVNHDFDLNDKYLDNSVTFGDSINIPIGSIQPISIYEELQKVYEQIQVGDNGILYIGYDGTFPVEFPKYEISSMDKTETVTDILGLSGMVTISPETEEFPLLSDAETTYEVIRPELVEDADFEIDPKKIEFETFIINADFKLPNINFNSMGDNARLTVSLTFPDNYILENSIAGDSHTIKGFAYIKNITGDYCSLGKIRIKSYTFDENTDPGITYKVALEGSGEEIKFTANNDPKFMLLLEGEKESISVSSLDCTINGIKEFEGTEDGLDGMQSAFDENNILEFKNPSMDVNLITNLGSYFELGINMSKENTNASLNSPLLFTNSAEKQHHTLSTEDFTDLEKLVSTPIPDMFEYKVSLIFKNQNAKLPSPSEITMETDYSFKIPFDFSRIELTIKDTIADLFDEDIYNMVFSHTKKNVAIEADLVDISIEGVDLEITAAILDADFKEIFHVDSEVKDQKPNLSFAIEGNNLEKMEKARHLEFSFRLSGEDAVITDKDYIEIKGLRIVSSSGIHFEL
jgi:hypothetical protein